METLGIICILLQAKDKGASPAMTAVIISAAPLTVMAMSPLIGYLVK